MPGIPTLILPTMTLPPTETKSKLSHALAPNGETALPYGLNPDNQTPSICMCVQTMVRCKGLIKDKTITRKKSILRFTHQNRNYNPTIVILSISGPHALGLPMRMVFMPFFKLIFLLTVLTTFLLLPGVLIS